MQITALPNIAYRAASNRPPELSSTASPPLWPGASSPTPRGAEPSASAARFLDAIIARMPFPVRAIQVDGGSEFQGAFEEACRERGVLLFVLPPHSPKLDGYAGVGRTWRSSPTSTMGS